MEIEIYNSHMVHQGKNGDAFWWVKDWTCVPSNGFKRGRYNHGSSIR